MIYSELWVGGYSNIVAIENGLVVEDKLDPKPDNTVVYIGRLSKWDKRVDRLLRIWKAIQKQYPNWNLEILGDGPEKESLEEMAIKLNLSNYHFRGFVDIKEYLPRASILVMTSSSEGFPMVILEAANYGLVPIAYNISSGISHLIKDSETGFLINPFDSKEYINKLSILMSDAELRSRIGNNAREMAKSYDIDHIFNRWILLIENLKKQKVTNAD